MKNFSKSKKVVSLITGIIIIFLAIMISYNTYYPYYVRDKIVGSWRSQTEGLYSVSFDSYGVVTESFKNEVLSKGEWKILRASSTEFELITTMDTDFHYIIKDINPKTMVLFDIVSEQEHIFEKIN